MSISKELLEISTQVSKYESFEAPELEALYTAAITIGKSWSGSWLGYHANVYYADFQPPPPGAAFSIEWGFDNALGMGTRGDWREYNYEYVLQVIREQAGDPNTDQHYAKAGEAKEKFEEARHLVLSLVHANYNLETNEFLQTLEKNIKATRILSRNDFIDHLRPSGSMLSRDRIALEKGLWTPAHISISAEVRAIKSPFESCKRLRGNIEKLAKHVQNLEKKSARESRMGTHVFIGHGHSPVWRELKDFINERLDLPWDEFNRVPTAGVTHVVRLAQMLDQACIAFLIMTAEDEDAEGKYQARMNVIHEAGLFQGRLGFEKAIVLLEEGCQEFSNIQGLGQIRFQKGNIEAIFEKVRQVLEREGIIE